MRALLRSPQRPELLARPATPGSRATGSSAWRRGDDDLARALAREREVDLVVVGPEAPLVAGLVDDLAEAGIARLRAVKRAAARIEGSKAYAKELMRDCGVPTAAHAVLPRPRGGGRASSPAPPTRPC